MVTQKRILQNLLQDDSAGDQIVQLQIQAYVQLQISDGYIGNKIVLGCKQFFFQVGEAWIVKITRIACQSFNILNWV